MRSLQIDLLHPTAIEGFILYIERPEYQMHAVIYTRISCTNETSTGVDTLIKNETGVCLVRYL